VAQAFQNGTTVVDNGPETGHEETAATTQGIAARR
jgi:hypothetical protein